MLDEILARPGRTCDGGTSNGEVGVLLGASDCSAAAWSLLAGDRLKVKSSWASADCTGGGWWAASWRGAAADPDGKPGWWENQLVPCISPEDSMP